MRTRAGTFVSGFLFAWLVSASLASGAAHAPVSVDVRVKPGRAVVIHLRAGCGARAGARLVVGGVVKATRVVTLRRAAARTISLALPPGPAPVDAQVSASPLGRGCR